VRLSIWRVLFWLAILAFLIEALGLGATLVDLRSRRADNAVGLAPDQIAAVARLWPSIDEEQRNGVIAALSWTGLSYSVTSGAPVAADDDAHVVEVEAALRKRLDAAQAQTVVALIRTRSGAEARRALNWVFSRQPIRIFVRLAPDQWLEADVRGELGVRLLGAPTGFWVGILGLLLASGVLIVILREGRAIARIARSVELFAATGEPSPFALSGSPEVNGLGRRTLAMQAQVASLLRERNHMLGAIAHDIKTYVQRLKLRFEVIEDPAQIDKAQRDLGAMNELVEDALLLALNANPRNEVELVDVHAVLAHEIEAARLSGGDVSLAEEGAGPFLITGEASGLSRALANIIGNALRYGKRARVRLRRCKGSIEAIVDDDGPGIPPAARKAAFQPFHRGESSRSRSTGGTGLGLAIAERIVERHGGAIAIADAPGGGARFIITLPEQERARQ